MPLHPGKLRRAMVSRLLLIRNLSRTRRLKVFRHSDGESSFRPA
jgi:hypothetical protein